VKTEAIEDIRAVLLLPQGERQVRLILKLVENPPPEILVKARINLYNKETFDFIQELQKDKRTLTNEAILAKVTAIDAILNEQITLCYKIKDREAKTEVLSLIYECKEKTSKLIELLRTTGMGTIDNYQLAQLNDLAYRGVQRRGLQKKLDERALKN
jgi:hypothetical protein